MSAKNFAGKLVLITGGTDGIGLQAALKYASMGAQVALPARNMDKAKRQVDSHFDATSKSNVHLMSMDLSNLGSVRGFVESFGQLFNQRLPNVLVNNAGLMQKSPQKTVDGFETTWQVNYLSHVLLTHEILTRFGQTTPAAQSMLVINTSSGLHKTAKTIGSTRESLLEAVDPQLKKPQAYDFWEVYSQTKMAQILYSNWLHRQFNGEHPLSVDPTLREVVSRLETKNVRVGSLAIDPGWIKTGLLRNEYGFDAEEIKKKLGGAKMTHQEGSHMLVWPALQVEQGVDLANFGGKLMAKERVIPEHKLVKDPDLQSSFWSMTRLLLSL